MKKRRYDTVIVDYHVPRLNGGQFINFAHDMWPTTPIIVMSGDCQILDQLGRVEGVSVRISKPFELPTLLHLIARLSNGNLPKDLHVDAYSRSFSQSLFVDNNCVH